MKKVVVVFYLFFFLSFAYSGNKSNSVALSTIFNNDANVIEVLTSDDLESLYVLYEDGIIGEREINIILDYLKNLSIEFNMQKQYKMLNEMLEFMLNKPKEKDVLIIGGGTGNSLISEICNALSLPMHGIISSFDDGGSTRRLMDSLESNYDVLIPPLGDIGEVIVAHANHHIQDVLQTRFLGDKFEGKRFLDSLRPVVRLYERKNGSINESFKKKLFEIAEFVDRELIGNGVVSLKGHSVKNLILLGILIKNKAIVRGETIDKDKFHLSLIEFAHVLEIKDIFVTITSFERGELAVRRINKKMTIGQHHITATRIEDREERIRDFLISGDVFPSINELALSMVKHTRKLVVMGPGSFYTSVMPNLMFPELVEYLAGAKNLTRVFIINPIFDNELRFQTLVDIFKFFKRNNIDIRELFDYVLVNDASRVSSDLEPYSENTEEEGKELWGLIKLERSELAVLWPNIKVIYGNFLSLIEKRKRAAGHAVKYILGYNKTILTIVFRSLSYDSKTVRMSFKEVLDYANINLISANDEVIDFGIDITKIQPLLDAI